MSEPDYIPPTSIERFWFEVWYNDPTTFEKALSEFPSPAIQSVADAIESMGADQPDNNK